MRRLLGQHGGVVTIGREMRRVPLWLIGLGALGLAGLGFTTTAYAISPGASALPTALVMPSPKSPVALAPDSTPTTTVDPPQLGVVTPVDSAGTCL